MIIRSTKEIGTIEGVVKIQRAAVLEDETASRSTSGVVCRVVCRVFNLKDGIFEV